MLVSPLYAQYPYWDAANPGESLDPNFWGDSGVFGYAGGGDIGNFDPSTALNSAPFAASGGAVYSVSGSSIVRWTPCDNGWETVGYAVNWLGNSGADPTVNAMCIHGNYLYVGGNFGGVVGPALTANASTGQDGITNQCACVAKMNLANGVWSPVDDGSLKLANFYNDNLGNEVDQIYVQSIAVDSNGKVYVGSGASDVIGPGNALSQVMLATWNGTNWVTVGNGLIAWYEPTVGVPYGAVHSLAADGTNIYVVGDFVAGIDQNGQSVPSQFLIKWDGTQWDSFADYSTNFPPGIDSVIVSSTNVFVSGELPYLNNSTYAGVNLFSTNGTQLAIDPLFTENLDPNTWLGTSLPGSGGGGLGAGLSVENSAVFLAGIFDSIGGQSVSPGVIEWTNNSFQSLGLGLGWSDNGTIYSGTANSIAADTNAVYVLASWGSFTSAGGQPIPYNASLEGQTARWVTGPDRPSGTITLAPVSVVGNAFTFTISGTPADCWTVQKLNVHGEWDSLCVVEVLTNAITFVDPSAYDSINRRIPYYRVINGCTISQPVDPFLLEKIALGGWFDLCVSNSFVWSWGNFNWGARGNGTNINGTATEPSMVVNAQYTLLTNIVSLAAGQYHALALMSNGTVWAWGLDYNGQLGDGQSGLIGGTGPPISFSYAKEVGNLKVGILNGISSISAGNDSSYALSTNGTLWAWGNNASGQLGNGTTTSTSHAIRVTNLTDIVAVSGGGNHALALRADGVVWAWGGNYDGQLGNNSTNNSLVPIEVPGLTNIIAIAAGGSSSYALQSNGVVYAWGSDSSGQLGDDSTNNSWLPEQIGGTLTGTSIANISACTDYCFATDVNGTLWSWGDNSQGQLGQGSYGGMLGPGSISFSDGSQTMEAAQGSAASASALSLQNNLSVQSWGDNSDGQLGRTGTNSATPYYVSGFQ